MIHYLHHTEINRSRWDECIQDSPDGLIYSCSWYLDLVSPGWEALVEDDYAAVMPLPVSLKWGIRYLRRPPYCQQLGLSARNPVNINLMNAFLAAVPEDVRLVDMPFNEGNMKIPGLDQSVFHPKPNYLLFLDKPYPDIRKGYATNTRRNLTKAEANGVLASQIQDMEELIDLKWGNAITRLNPKYRSVLLNIWDHVREKGESELVGVRDNEGKLMAGALFIRFRNRWTYLLSASSSSGKADRAMFAVVDHFIRNHAGEPLMLDFEGSVLFSLARFFAGFGASEHPYPHLHINRLPALLRWIKR